MSFILKMAWRDSRTSRRRLFLFSLSVVLGIAALVAIGSFTENLRQAIQDQAKTLLGADLAVESRQNLPPDAEAYFREWGGEQAKEVSLASMAVFPSSGNQTKLISLRAMAGAYPFYGDFQTVPADAPAKLRAGGDGAILEESLLAQFGLKVGDPVKLGQKTFQVIGALKKIPGDSPAVAMLSPRVYISLSALPGTELVVAGSQVRYKTYFKIPGQDIEARVADAREHFRSLRLNFDTVERRKRDLGQGLQNVYAFLSLVGFIALFLGAIGVASAIHVYIRQKIATIAVLRCLGASARQSFAVYLVQGFALGVAGAVLGALLGILVQIVLPAMVKDFLPFKVDFFVSWISVARGMGAGLVVCLLFTLLPLLSIRRVSPLVALRSSFAEQGSGRDPWRYFLYALIALAVVGFAIAQTQKLKIGLGFAGMLAVSFGVLTLLARGVAWIAQRFLPRGLSYVWRQGVANLHRPNNRTVLLLLSLGLGTFLLLTLGLARETLLAQLRGMGGGDRPNLMFFDIQDDQIGPLEQVLHDAGAPIIAQAPIVTMRIRTINGRTIEDILKGEHSRIPGWTLRREYRSTFRGHLVPTEKLLAGKFESRVAPGTSLIPISVEEGLAKDMQLQLGDQIEWDVQGVPMTTQISSLRSVDWQRFQPNFYVVFPEGALEDAPKFYLAAVRANSSGASARAQQLVVQKFPNVSAIDLDLILQTLDTIFAKVEFVVRFIALFTVATGAIVLAGAVLTGRFQRLRETVLLRTLGATRKQLMQIQLAEYAVLGFLGALTGGGLAFLANALLAKFVFELPVVAPLGYLAGAAVGVTVLTIITGLLANRGVAQHPPLEVLRQEA